MCTVRRCRRVGFAVRANIIPHLRVGYSGNRPGGTFARSNNRFWKTVIILKRYVLSRDGAKIRKIGRENRRSRHYSPQPVNRAVYDVQEQRDFETVYRLQRFTEFTRLPKRIA